MKLVKIETSESGKPSETCEPGDSNGSGEGWWRHLPVVRGDLVLNEAVDEGANPLLTQTLAPNILLRSNFFNLDVESQTPLVQGGEPPACLIVAIETIDSRLD